MTTQYWIYHERQDAVSLVFMALQILLLIGCVSSTKFCSASLSLSKTTMPSSSKLLCGQHALNNLLQSNAFSPSTLSDIAHQLDEMELTYMSQNNEGGVHSKDYLQRIAEGSGNVDASGNFSIEVLRAALMNGYGLELPNIKQQSVLSIYRAYMYSTKWSSTTISGYW